MNDEILATVTPSPMRRWMAVAMLVALGGLLVWLAITVPPQSLVLQLFLLALGCGALVMADLIRRATETHIALTAEGLRDGNGRLLCRMDQIAGVDRGAFAFKPSNGFLVKLKEPMPRVWQPGLWWRLGRRIGVGGVTPAGQGKFMADMIALKLRGDHDLFAERK